MRTTSGEMWWTHSTQCALHVGWWLSSNAWIIIMTNTSQCCSKAKITTADKTKKKFAFCVCHPLAFHYFTAAKKNILSTYLGRFWNINTGAPKFWAIYKYFYFFSIKYKYFELEIGFTELPHSTLYAIVCHKTKVILLLRRVNETTIYIFPTKWDKICVYESTSTST